MRIRSGDNADLPAVLAMFDEAVAWLAERGSTEQWGADPWTEQPDKVERIAEKIDEGDLWIALVDEVPAGAMITSDKPSSYIEQVDETELYIQLLLTSRRYAGRKIGAELLAHARSLVLTRHIGLMRVDCYAGGDGDLVRYYERQGFMRTKTFTVGDWPGQLLEQRW